MKIMIIQETRELGNEKTHKFSAFLVTRILDVNFEQCCCFRYSLLASNTLFVSRYCEGTKEKLFFVFLKTTRFSVENGITHATKDI